MAFCIYAELGIEQADATPESIKKAYACWLKANHPDVLGQGNPRLPVAEAVAKMMSRWRDTKFCGPTPPQYDILRAEVEKALHIAQQAKAPAFTLSSAEAAAHAIYRSAAMPTRNSRPGLRI